MIVESRGVKCGTVSIPGKALDRDRCHQAAHARPRAWVVVDVDDVRLSGLADRSRRFEQRAVVAAEWGVELDRDDELVRAEQLLQLGLVLFVAVDDRQASLVNRQRARRRAVRVDRAANRGDLGGRRPAAAADHAGAEAARLRRELREVLRRRVRIDDAVPGQARQADVRQRSEHEPVALHVLERGERARGTGAVVRAHGGDAHLGESLARVPRRHAAEGLRLVVERHQRDDRQTRHAADGLDRGFELVEVVERLDHEQVRAAAFEDRRLLGEQLGSRLGTQLDVAERADRARDEDVAARYLARFAREADTG